MKQLIRKWQHWRWVRRYNKAKRIAEYKANAFYHEDICACHPDFYFKSELDGLKNLPDEYYNNH